MKKKIAYILDYPVSVVGGAQLSTLNLVEKINKTSYEIYIICPEDKKKIKKEKSVHIVEYKLNKRIINRYMRALIMLKELFKILRKDQFDIIHIQMPMSMLVVGILKKLRLIKVKNIIFTDRGLAIGYKKLTKQLMLLGMKECKKIVCTTHINVGLWRNEFESLKLYMIPNGTDFEGTNIIHKNKVLNIGFAGRMTEVKNWDLSIEIIKKLILENININIFCAFSTYLDEDKIKIKEYEEKYISLLGKDKVEIYINLDKNEMIDFYSKLDIFILTSSFESFGRTAIEAMACYCCVLGTNIVGLKEVIGSKKYLYELDNINNCIKIIKNLSKNRKQLEYEKQYFYNRYKKYFSLEKVVKEYEKLYKTIY